MGIIEYFKSNEFLQIAVKVLGLATLFLLLVVLVFIIANKIKNRRRYETTIPYHGEIRGGKVYCALTDPLFSSVRDRNPDSTISDHIQNDLDTDIEANTDVYQDESNSDITKVFDNEEHTDKVIDTDNWQIIKSVPEFQKNSRYSWKIPESGKIPEKKIPEKFPTLEFSGFFIKLL